MIIILHEKRHLAESTSMAAAFRKSYPDLQVQLLSAETTVVWPAAETWSDVLVVPFDGGAISPSFPTFLSSLGSRTSQPFVLPVTLHSAHHVPPGALNAIKALPYEGGSFARGCRRIGAHIGLSLRSRDHTIFLSYRQVDGVSLATQLEQFLRGEGYHVWRDDSKDKFDGQSMIPPGEPVQVEIEESLKRADMVLLLDTPRAAESYWIDLEMKLANGNLIPVLPVLLRRPKERVNCSRFRTLDTLQRAVIVELPDQNVPDQFSPAELDSILEEMETYLCEIVQRRLKVPHAVRQQFQAVAYEWVERDRFIYEAVRRSGARLMSRVFSHCSIFDGVYNPALRAFIEHLKKVDPRANYALYIYDGPLIPSVQLREIERAAELQNSADVILLHHQEVLTVLQSNFTTRP